MSKKYFETRFANNYANQESNPTNNKKLREIISLGYKKGKLLDIGCAFGFFLKEADRLGFETYGVDSSSYALNQAKKHTKAKLFHFNTGKQSLPFSNINVCVTLNTLEHVENYFFLLKSINKALKKNGLFFVYVPVNKRWLTDETHINYFTVDSLKFVMGKAGFRILKIGEEGGKFQIPFGLVRLVLKGNTNFNYVPQGTGSFISCFAIKK